MINCKSTITSYVKNKNVTIFLRDIRKFKLLTRQEEYNLLYTFKYGNVKDSINARNKLICHNQRFVVSFAKHLTNGDDLLDLISEGNLGLITAIEKYDLKSKNRFITYASYWVRKYMDNYIIQNNKMVKPKNANRVYEYSDKVKNDFFIKNGRYLNEYEIVDILKEKGVKSVNKDDFLDINIESIDSKVYNLNDEEYDKLSLLMSSNNVNEIIKQYDKEKEVENFFNYLDEEETYIIKNFFGFGCYEKSIYELSLILNENEKIIENKIRNSLLKLKNKLKNKGYG